MTRGWGTIRRRRSGYQVDIRIGPERIRRMVPTAELAEEVLRELQRSRALGTVGLRAWSTVTVAGLAPKLLERYEGAGLAARTLESYRQQTAALVSRIGDRQIANLRRTDVDQVTAEMTREGLSPSSQRHVLDRLSQLLELAVDEGILPERPFKIRRPPLRAVRPKRAVAEDALALMVRAGLQVVHRAPLAAILLAADAGLRRTEIEQIRGEDLLLDRGWLRVLGKGGKARAVPILTSRLAEALGTLPADADPLLGCRTRGQLAALVRPLWQAAHPGSEPRWHELRRRFATCVAGAPDGSLDSLRAWLGHSTAQTTLLYVLERPPAVPPGVRSALEGHPAGTAAGRGRKSPEA